MPKKRAEKINLNKFKYEISQEMGLQQVSKNKKIKQNKETIPNKTGK